MTHILDTNIIIYLIKKKSRSIAECVTESPPNDHPVISFIIYDELLKGANGSRSREKLLFFIAQPTERISVVYPGENICICYGKQVDVLKHQGMLIGGNALRTVCHALTHGTVLVTNNTREFERAGELATENRGEG